MKVSYEGFVEMLSELNQFIANDYNPNYIRGPGDRRLFNDNT